MSTALRFAGYAALFDIRDADRDVIRKGAFERTLAGRASKVPVLWQHRPGRQIGTAELIAEDTRGLRIVGRIDADTDRAAAALKQGEVTGLSFGYRARTARHSDQGRELLEIDLFEVSLVTHPLQHGARVHLIA